MGAVKDFYHDEINRRQRWVTRIHFECPHCEAETHDEIEVPEPNYMAERSRDMVTEADTEISCSHCGAIFDAYVYSGPASCDIQLREFPETNVFCDTPGYDSPPDDWLEDFEIPEKPTTVAKANLAELRGLIQTLAINDGSSLINRMIFAQVLTFLEAYLCDTLVSGLRRLPDRLANFAAKDGSISGIEFRAIDILRDPNHVRKTVENNLKSRLYHQFGAKREGKKSARAEGVPLWYGMAFGFPITPTDEDLDLLREFATLRHDCVHRNGKTKDDKVLTQFDKPYLLKAIDLAERVVDHVDGQLEKLISADILDSSDFL